MGIQLQTSVEISHNKFTVTGPQLDSKTPVRMVCTHRSDGGPARFIFRDSTIEATVGNICNHDERGLTTVGKDGILIRQVEHILSALLGMNALATDIEMSFVGSNNDALTIAPPVAYLNAEDFVVAIRRSFNIQNLPTRLEIGWPLVVEEKKPQNARDPSFAIFAPLDRLVVTAQINFPYFWGRQAYSCSLSPKTYEAELAWARSFFSTPYPHKQEWETLRRRYPALLKERLNHARSVMIDYTTQRWLTPLREKDEPVRHKLLDFLGDLALLEAPLRAGIFVYKPYHGFNRQCVSELARKVLE